MNPLMVAGGIGKGVNTRLLDGEPWADGYLLSHQ
jgi:hypothetical protein